MKETLELILMFIIFCLAFVGAMSIIETKCGLKPPVEESGVVDSLTTVNDSLKIKVNNLDSIKNAKIIEVYTLDSDSTVKLFYELVKGN